MFPPPSRKQETNATTSPPQPSRPPAARPIVQVKLEPECYPSSIDAFPPEEKHAAEIKAEALFFDDLYAAAENESEDEDEDEDEDTFSFYVDEEEAERRRRGVKRRRMVRNTPSSKNGMRNLHIHSLGRLLERISTEHRWKEAAGVLSVLMRGSASFSAATDDDHRRNHVAAMEIHRRFRGMEGWRYQNWVQQIYEEWMRKLSWSKKSSSIKKTEVQSELALFYLTQGLVEEAKSAMRLVLEDCNFANEPSVHLLYGIILYQTWYSSLPEEFKLNGSSSCKPFQAYDSVSADCHQESQINESSHNHYAVDIKDVNFSSRYASESSVGNDKVFMECKIDARRIKPHASAAAQEFYISQSKDTNEQKSGSNLANNLQHSSIFFANGLDTSLLPIQLPHMTKDIGQYIEWYRKLTNEDYRGAVNHLKLALRSTPPVHAALLPLIQLLLLGDRVDEALNELENSCHKMDTALPFRLMARLLECFQSNKATVICSCYENALRRDPLCSHSLERLIKMHKNGNCSTMLLFEMIALHLDAADGKCSIWEEFAECFRGLLTATLIEYEDCTSINPQRGGETNKIYTNRIPRFFFEENARGPWKLRFDWWRTRHFGSSSLLDQSGDQKLLCFKAACASQLYGPTYGYVIQVLRTLREEKSDDGHISILSTHMKDSMKLCESL
ncbi:Uncharacterized protein M6B38_228140 [Iris pallida]|uniref:Uncharacterized protein n=1 Tax=Iris pallida TaxID=29817 RepID=A0AAX6DST4_IRIPA|nr:Uncharacterized protein M6B38_228140 [Iris pallida]